MAVSTEPVADLVMPPTDHHPHPYHGPTKAEVLAMRKEYCNPAISTYYKEPLMIVEGHMQYLYDETGRRYLDMLAGIVTVSCGHCHPKVTAKIKEQVDTLQHATTIYAHPNMPALAKKLASKMPKGLDVTYFVNSGSEANDLAIQMARLYTGNADVIAQELTWLSWIAGRSIRAVTAQTGKIGTLELAAGTPDHQELIVEFDGGLMFSMHYDLNDRTHERLVRLASAEGTAKWSNLQPHVEFYSAAEKEWPHRSALHHFFALESPSVAGGVARSRCRYGRPATPSSWSTA